PFSVSFGVRRSFAALSVCLPRGPVPSDRKTERRSIAALQNTVLCVNAAPSPLRETGREGGRLVAWLAAWGGSGGQLQQAPGQGAEIRLARPARQSGFSSLLQYLPLQRLALVRVRQPSWPVVPRAGASVHQI